VFGERTRLACHYPASSPDSSRSEAHDIATMVIEVIAPVELYFPLCLVDRRALAITL
jgi:hypothetical protein